MRWTAPLSNRDEFDEVAQFLGYADTGLMIPDMLTGESDDDHPHRGQLEGDITQFEFYLGTVITTEQRKAAAAAAAQLQESSVNDILLFDFNGTPAETIINALLNIIDGKVARPANGSTGTRKPARTISDYTFNAVGKPVNTFSEMVQCVIVDLLADYPDVAVDKLCQVNGAIKRTAAEHREGANIKHCTATVNPDDENPTVIGVFVDVKKSSDQLEALARKCIVAFRFKPEELVITP